MGGLEENGIRKISQKTYFWSVVEESCVGAVAGCEYMSDELVQRVREEDFYNYFSIFIKKFRVFSLCLSCYEYYFESMYWLTKIP